MGKGYGGNAAQFVVSDGLASCPELRDDPCHVHGIPHQRRIGQQTEAGGLIHNLFVIARLKGALVREEQATSKLVSLLPPVFSALLPGSLAGAGATGGWLPVVQGGRQGGRAQSVEKAL